MSTIITLLHWEFIGSDASETEVVNTSGMDEDRRLITVTTAQADEVCITLDKLIRNGLISKEFFRNTLRKQ